MRLWNLEKAVSIVARKQQKHYVEEAEKQIDEITNQGLDWFKDNAAFLGIFGAFIILMFVMVKREEQQNEKARQAAWQDYTEAEDSWRNDTKKDEKTPPFAKVAKKHSNSSVVPFALLDQADVYYQRGSQEDLKKAKELLKTFQARSGTLTRYTKLAENKLAAIEAELAFAPAWADTKKNDPKQDQKSKANETKKPESKPLEKPPAQATQDQKNKANETKKPESKPLEKRLEVPKDNPPTDKANNKPAGQ